jgi:hypothetical protein
MGSEAAENEKNRIAGELCGRIRRSLLSQTPFMGEEKPDEELMGKRKSSPRLSTTYMMSLALSLPVREVLYIGRRTFFSNARRCDTIISIPYRKRGYAK